MLIPFGVFSAAGAGGGGAAGAYELISTTLISSDTASITFTNGGWSTYKHLQIRFTARNSNAATTNDNVNVRLNSDTGSNYSWHELNGNGSTVVSNAGTSQTFMRIVDSVACASNDSGIFGSGVIDILDFSSTSKNTTIKALAGSNSGEKDIALSSGLWNNTAAVTSVTLYPNQNSWVSGSRFSLYGIRG